MARTRSPRPPRPRLRPGLLLGALAPLLLVLGIWLGGHPERLPDPVRDALVGDTEAQLVDDAIDEVHGDYFREVPRDRLVNAAIDGMVRSLRDRFSSYFSPSEYDDFRAVTDAQFSGVGMEIRQDPRGLRIVRVYDESPAARARLGRNDLVVAVNGRSLAGRASDDASRLIRGRPGTEVRLTVVSGERRRTVVLTRATVSVPVVSSSLARVPGGARVATVSLAQFSSGAHGELRQAIDRRLRQGARGLVLDLRGNGGGLVEESRLVASIFISEGTIVTTRGRSQPTRTLTAAGGAIADDVPVVVLVDRATASASEIVTGALQDRERARVVGTNTFGKGVFQEVTTLPNGGALDLTVGRYFTPKGRNLGGGGVDPGSGIRPDVRAQDDLRTAPDEAERAALRVLGEQLGRR